MAGRILLAALQRLRQDEKFDDFCAYLQTEWISTEEDLRQASRDEHVWQSLRLPARLKVEMRLLLEDEAAAGLETVDADDGIDPPPDSEDEWVLYFSEEHQYYYYYNARTGESQWADAPADADADADGADEAADEAAKEAPPAPPNTSTHAAGGSAEFVFPKGYTRTESMRRQQLRRQRRDRRHRVEVQREDVASSSDDDEGDEAEGASASDAEWPSGGEADDASSDASEYFIVSDDAGRGRLRVERYRVPRDSVEPSAPPLPPAPLPTVAIPPPSPPKPPTPAQPPKPPPAASPPAAPARAGPSPPPQPPVAAPGDRKAARPKLGKALNKLFGLDVGRVIGRAAPDADASG